MFLLIMRLLDFVSHFILSVLSTKIMLSFIDLLMTNFLKLDRTSSLFDLVVLLLVPFDHTINTKANCIDLHT